MASSAKKRPQDGQVVYSIPLHRLDGQKQKDYKARFRDEARSRGVASQLSNG